MGARRSASGLVAGGLVLVFALAGVGAALLAGAPSPLAHPSSSQVTFSLPSSIWALLFVAPMLVGFLAYVLRWIADSSAGTPARIGASIAVILLVVALLASLFTSTSWTGHSAISLGTSGSGSGYGGGNGNGPGGNGSADNSTLVGNGSGTGSGTGSGNGTLGGGLGTRNGTRNGSGNLSQGTGGNGSRNSSGSGTGGRSGNNSTVTQLGAAPTQGASFRLANWVFLLVAVGLSVVVGLLAVPGVLARLVDRRRPSAPALSAIAIGARRRGPQAVLETERDDTPRGSILRQYRRLLGRLSTYPGELTAATAQEIRKTRLAELHVPPPTSEALTKMFEEACYSNHPIDSPEADRFIGAVREVERALFVAGVLD